MKTRGSLDWFDLELGQDLAADLELSLELTIGLTSCQISEADFCRQVLEADFCCQPSEADFFQIGCMDG